MKKKYIQNNKTVETLFIYAYLCAVSVYRRKKFKNKNYNIEIIKNF